MKMSNPFLAYIDGKSFLHKLDPRTKIITLMILSIIIFNTYRIWSLLSIFMLFLVVAVAARISIKKMFVSVKPMLVFIFIVFLLHFIFAPAPVFSDAAFTAHAMDRQLNTFSNAFNVEYWNGGQYEIYYYQTAPGVTMPTILSLRKISNRAEEVGFQLILMNDADEDQYLEKVEVVPVEFLYKFGLPTNYYDSFIDFEKDEDDVDNEENLDDENYNDGIYLTAAPKTPPLMMQPTMYNINVFGRNLSIYPSIFSFLTGLGISLKFTLLILFASLMAATTKQSALIQGIEKLVRPIPLKWANLTSHDLALMILLTIRFIPLLISTAERIRDSSRSRSFVPSKNPLKAIKITATGLVNSIIVFADDVSKAMQNRSYTGIGRIYTNELKFGKRDAVFFCAFFLAIGFIIITVGRIQYMFGTI